MMPFVCSTVTSLEPMAIRLIHEHNVSVPAMSGARLTEHHLAH